MKKVNPGKESRFIKALEGGRTISRQQAQCWFKLGNASATILRAELKGVFIVRKYSGFGKTRRVKYSVAKYDF